MACLLACLILFPPAALDVMGAGRGGGGAIRPDHPRAPDPVEMTESGVHAPNDNSL
jgi:hypothetical protein